MGAPRSLGGPFALWTLGLQMTYMAVEASNVIAMRSLGMAGLWSVTPQEKTRMVSEKVAAMQDSISAQSSAAFRGAGPVAIASAGLKPYRRRTKANAKRLTRRGPTKG